MKPGPCKSSEGFRPGDNCIFTPGKKKVQLAGKLDFRQHPLDNEIEGIIDTVKYRGVFIQ